MPEACPRPFSGPPCRPLGRARGPVTRIVLAIIRFLAAAFVRSGSRGRAGLCRA